MRKWISVLAVVALAISLVAGVLGHGIANAKSLKPQDQVKNFMNAAAGLKVDKAVSYWVPSEYNNVTSQLNSVPSGIKISLSNLKLVVTSQTTDTAGVSVTYNIKIKVKGQATINKSNESAAFTLNLANKNWLIASSDIWSKEPWSTSAVTSAATPKPTSTASSQPTTSPSKKTSKGSSSLGDILSKGANIASVKYDMSMTASGYEIKATVWQKKHKMREEMTMQGITTVTLIDTDANTMYTYMPTLNMATKTAVDASMMPQGTMGDADTIMSYKPKIVGTESIDGKACTVITYDMPGLGSAKEWIWNDKGFPLKLEATSSMGNVTIEYSNVDFSDIPDSTFALPAGVQITSDSGLESEPTTVSPEDQTTIQPTSPVPSTAEPSNGGSSESSTDILGTGTYTGGPIYIGSDEDFTRANGVVSGTGTRLDPFIIEGWTIDCSTTSSSNGIYVDNAITKYYIIRNCSISNSQGMGICVGNNVNIENCTITNCQYGINDSAMSNMQNDKVTISNNTITNCQLGICIVYCKNCSLTGNKISKCSTTGIAVETSDYCHIDDNICLGNGTTLDSNSDFGIHINIGTGYDVSNNEVRNNAQGIAFKDTLNCTASKNIITSNKGEGLWLGEQWDNTITKCLISNNTVSSNGGDGIRIDTNGNTASNNTANNNTGYGIFLGDTAADNNVIDNTTTGNQTQHQDLDDRCDIMSNNNSPNNNNTFSNNAGILHIWRD